MATKRIYQIAKEFECDEKKIIEFLTTQGIKVANRLSAVSEETYKLLKIKLFAPPEPPPPPEPKPAVEKSAQIIKSEPLTESAPAQSDDKKKKKKKKKAQQEEELEARIQEIMPISLKDVEAATQLISGAGLDAGNEFLKDYVPIVKKRNKNLRTHLTKNMDVWGLLQDLVYDYPETSPIRYWQAVNKLVTSASKLLQDYGLKNRMLLAEMREAVKVVGVKYEPREIFTEEENQKFAAQQEFLFKTFGHGMGAVNDELFKLKMYAEHRKISFERMDFVEYLTNPDGKLDTKISVPFEVIAESIAYSISSIPRHVDFYLKNKERIAKIIDNFFMWIDGYKKLKEQGAAAAKLEKYLELEEKFISLVDFVSFDNLLKVKKSNNTSPFDILLELLNGYRDNMDDPDAERNFKYKVRGVSNIAYKPKEYVFLYQFADLESNKDYRPTNVEEKNSADKQEENPAEESDEAQSVSKSEE